MRSSTSSVWLTHRTGMRAIEGAAWISAVNLAAVFFLDDVDDDELEAADVGEGAVGIGDGRNRRVPDAGQDVQDLGRSVGIGVDEQDPGCGHDPSRALMTRVRGLTVGENTSDACRRTLARSRLVVDSPPFSFPLRAGLPSAGHTHRKECPAAHAPLRTHARHPPRRRG